MNRIFRLLRFFAFQSDNLKSKTCTEPRRSIENPKWVGIFTIALTFGFGGVVATAQQPKKVPRIGYLSPLSRSVGDNRREGFRQGLHELGYVEGKNIVIEYRWAEGKLDRLPELAAELVRLKLDVIVTRGTLSTRALKDATTTIPIVVIGAGDLVGRGLVASLARPSGNITGSTSIAPDLSGKRLELLKETVPKVTRVAVFYQPHEEDELRGMQIAARALGVQVQSLEVKESSQFESAYAAMRTERADGLIVFSNPLTNFNRRQLIDLAIKNRLPAMCEEREWTNDGCLMSYAPNQTDLARRAAIYMDKILKGAKPGELPVEQPTKFEFIVNLKTAKQIGLTIPPNVLARADKVIK